MSARRATEARAVEAWDGPADPALEPASPDFLLGVRMSDAYEGEALGQALAVLVNRVGIHATWLVISSRRLYVLVEDPRLCLPHVIHGEAHFIRRGERAPVSLRRRGGTTFLRLTGSQRAFIANGRLADPEHLQATLERVARALGECSGDDDDLLARRWTSFAEALDTAC